MVPTAAEISATDAVRCAPVIWRSSLSAVPPGALEPSLLEAVPSLHHCSQQSCTMDVAAVAEWYRYQTVACLVTNSSPVPRKTRRVGQRCTLNLSKAETSSRWECQEELVLDLDEINIVIEEVVDFARQINSEKLLDSRNQELKAIELPNKMSYSGNIGNVRADQLAKEATRKNMNLSMSVPLTLETISLEKNCFHLELQILGLT
ncbi:hypothetical protein TNCV_1278481 [Trichonephila clavipes]|nr:hypothetical protein TNCV_1278481 [Trichonephila clavipes]